jgi:AraC-like DNA-binding protein
MWQVEIKNASENIGVFYNGIERISLKEKSQGIEVSGDRAAIYLKCDEYRIADTHDGVKSTFDWKPGMLAYVPPGRPTSNDFIDGKIASLGLMLPSRISHELREFDCIAKIQRGVIDNIALLLFQCMFTMPVHEDPLKIDYVTHALLRCVRGWHIKDTDLRKLAFAKIGRAVDYMQTNYAKRLTTEELAEVACVSPFHFIRQFKRVIGFTPHEYMMRVRGDRARMLLLAGRLSLATIAFSCGYANQAHMTTQLRQATGHTPRQFRMLGDGHGATEPPSTQMAQG